MDEKLGKFIEDFGTLTRLAQSGLDQADDGEQLLQALTGHLTVPAHELSVVTEEIPPHRLVDVDIVMEGLAGRDPDYRLVGIGGGDQRHHMSARAHSAVPFCSDSWSAGVHVSLTVAPSLFSSILMLNSSP